MPNLIEKAKEQIQESIVQILFGAIAGLMAVIAAYVGPLVLPVFNSIPNNVLLTLLALSLLINIGLWYYVSHLSKQLRNLQDTKFTKRFGILWDKNYEPHCPSCKNMPSGYQEIKGTPKNRRAQFTCVNCKTTIQLSDQDGFVPLDYAREQLKQENIGYSV